MSDDWRKERMIAILCVLAAGNPLGMRTTDIAWEAQISYSTARYLLGGWLQSGDLVARDDWPRWTITAEGRALLAKEQHP